MKRLIVITRPDFFDHEIKDIIALFKAGLQILHLRKPAASAEEIQTFLYQIPHRYWSRIVLHEHFNLASVFPVKGIHLNRRNPQPPANFQGQISCSCHSLEEVIACKNECSYVFLSPIFDSISKAGYNAAFTTDALERARQKGIIDQKVIALGGIDEQHLSAINRMGFGGAALLGDVWKYDGEKLTEHFRRIMQLAQLRPPTVLSVAGSDPSGGAGIQADLKTISALGGYAATAITAITVQNTLGVQAVYPLPADRVVAQLNAVMEDLDVDAIKIGMVHNTDIVQAIVQRLQYYAPHHIIFDPVMVSTSGRQLMQPDTVRVICKELLPLCSLVTPNLNEASLLCGDDIHSVEDMRQAACALGEQYGTAFLIKGGHLAGETMCDILYHHGSYRMFTHPKIVSSNLHGTGCTLSSAIATYLAQGEALTNAVGLAKAYISQAIEAGATYKIGQGNGPLWHFFQA